jgi:disulfide bond formation protein DsbB
MLQKYWFYIVTLFSAIALTSALIAEFYFNLAPCEMCLKQREPYYIIIFGFIFITILRWQTRIWFYLGVQLISIYGLFYSIWHVGIENQLLSGPAGCSVRLNNTNNILSLKEQILAKPVINCEDIAWSIFGLSAATINSLLLFLIFILNAIYLWSSYGSEKEKNN